MWVLYNWVDYYNVQDIITKGKRIRLVHCPDRWQGRSLRSTMTSYLLQIGKVLKVALRIIVNECIKGTVQKRKNHAVIIKIKKTGKHHSRQRQIALFHACHNSATSRASRTIRIQVPLSSYYWIMRAIEGSMGK